VLGTSDACIATYPGDFAIALIALDAVVEIAGPHGTTRKSFSGIHRSPRQTPQIETSLEPGELIVAFEIPPSRFARRSRYVKVRDRESYEFALASAAVALDLDNGAVREARIALGGVATRPWRAREAEESLRGKQIDEASASAAADVAYAGAKARAHNGFKIPLGKSTLIRALLETASMGV
jgi:xanthine dehydrogenase YagS FAD-binding subunit